MLDQETLMYLKEFEKEGLAYRDPQGRWHLCEDVELYDNEDGTATAIRKAPN